MIGWRGGRRDGWGIFFRPLFSNPCKYTGAVEKIQSCLSQNIHRRNDTVHVNTQYHHEKKSAFCMQLTRSNDEAVARQKCLLPQYKASSIMQDDKSPMLTRNLIWLYFKRAKLGWSTTFLWWGFLTSVLCLWGDAEELSEAFWDLVYPPREDEEENKRKTRAETRGILLKIGYLERKMIDSKKK